MNGLIIIMAAIIVAAVTSLFICKIMNDIYQAMVLKSIDNMYEELQKVTVEIVRNSINNK